ncbi:MAG: site-specific DNA-methyltransferase [Nitrospinae bacterium]|nr:site-specific DNA-methyltransferase [Nitrospinota bacterium]
MESGGRKRPIVQYTHDDKERLNNPPVGLVDSGTDSDAASPKKQYAYDPHIDPALQWAGKAERTSFEIPTVSLHVHERIDPKKIIEAIKKKNGGPQTSFFDMPAFNPPLREAVEFYKHKHGWSNRLIAGDSLLVMNSLLEKEGLGGHVQMVYIDPPYGIKYGSNFQPFVNKRQVKDGSDEDLTAEPETIKAFRDTWELGIHSYLAYLRDRFLLARDLLAETGSIFVQISDENVHLVRNLMDEVFGVENFVSLISVTKTSSATTELLAGVADYLLWYGKNKESIKYRDLFEVKELSQATSYSRVELSDGTRRPLTPEEIEDINKLPQDAKPFTLGDLTSQRPPGSFPVLFRGKTYVPRTNFWKTGEMGFKKLIDAGRIEPVGNVLRYVRYFGDFAATARNNMWTDFGGATDKVYVVQTNAKVIQRCLLMTTDPGDLVLDITCGSGTTATVAEQWGRRWITCDTSRVATALAKQRLMTATFDYYELAHPHEGVGSGFNYKTVPHVTLKSIANNPEIKEGMGKEQIERAIAKYAEQETLYDQPIKESGKVRVTGPFTVEAVPAPSVKSIDEIDGKEQPQVVDATIARSGATLRQSEWRGELLRTGIRGKHGNKIEFERVETLPGTRWLHADATAKAFRAGTSRAGEHLGIPERVVISFGPEHAPLEQRQVEHAIQEAHKLVPKPKIIVFAAFQFDPEAAKDIDETEWPGVTLLKAQMNADLLTDDLKKKRSSNESFWLIGQPDIRLEKIKSGEDKGKYRITVHGFDYYNTKTGNIESGGHDRIAMWMLDPDYDGRCIFPRQVFFPMADEKEGWSKLAKNLKAEIDPELAAAYTGTVSLPFGAGEHKKAAVKIIDDRGIESLKLLDVE